MIAKILDELRDLKGLQGMKGPKLFPLGADISEISAPMATYTVQGPEDARVLSGEIAYYSATVTVDFLADTYDEAVALYWAARAAFETAQWEDLLRLEITSPQADFYVRDLQLYAKRMAVAIDWRPEYGRSQQ